MFKHFLLPVLFSCWIACGGMLIVEMHALDNVKSPREKLEILLGIHKILVDGLTFPPENGDSTSAAAGRNSNSSADMLLPVLIYRYLPPFLRNLISTYTRSQIQVSSPLFISFVFFR